ncbi:hypothetical protein M0R45_035091 [Rubus argutus]|uniref:Uncharacterized protein n=1 Tax=Rubus argutus TaxID=59490 RepID=A0AAW1VS31_RUBAR
MIGTPFEPGTDPNRRFPTSIIVAAPRTWCEQFCLPHQPLATYHVSMLRWYSRWARTCEERAARGARVVVRGARRDKDFGSRASMVLSRWALHLDDVVGLWVLLRVSSTVGALILYCFLLPRGAQCLPKALVVPVSRVIRLICSSLLLIFTEQLHGIILLGVLWSLTRIQVCGGEYKKIAF